MNSIGVYQTYKNVVEIILRDVSGPIAKAQLFEAFNQQLHQKGMKTKSMKSLERILAEMKNEGYLFEEQIYLRQKYIELQDIPGKTLISKEDIDTFPLLFGHLSSGKVMPSVKKIMEMVAKEYDLSSKELLDERFFVKSEPEINNHAQIMVLAGKLIRFARRGIAIKYCYRNKEGIEKFKYVAPLQVRLYDFRYYLLGVDMDSETGEASPILKNYCLDTFLNFDVQEAYFETTEEMSEPEIIRFNHAELYKKSQLENKLNYSLGIWYDPTNELKKFKLKFYDWAKGIVLNKKLHKTQRIIENKDNYVVITLDVWNNHEIDYVLDRFGDKCERLD